MTKNIPSISQVIKSSQPVNLNLQQRLECHAYLLRLIKESLPKSLADNCSGCCLNSSTLVLYSRSSAWISQLRFYKPVLLEFLNVNAPGHRISDIVFRVLVTPDGLSPPYRKSPHKKPSCKTINELADSTRYISDKKLRSSLEKLVQTLRRQNKHPSSVNR